MRPVLLHPTRSTASGLVDPTRYTLDELARIRGSMWTCRANVPYGPRPNAPDNINAFPYYDCYDATGRATMIREYKARGYTHTVHGPVTGNDCYHGKYPCFIGLPPQSFWDSYLDAIQEIWDAGLMPIYFCHPDGWTLPDMSAQMDQVDALYRQPRAQRILRIVVYSGWEPSGSKYGWNNEQYVAWLKRGAAVFPHALRLLHHVCDLDAPTGGNDSDIFPPGEGNAISWANVAPYIHGWLDQVCGYVNGPGEVPTQGFLDSWASHVKRCTDGFRDGVGGWPTFSAWGQAPIRYYASEYAAYRNFWDNWNEKYSLQIGDAAMAAGADGYLDGGTVDVPLRGAA
jgi:hypothetical protein